MRSTCACGNEIHPGRTELGLDTCINCASHEKPHGSMVYDQKTGAQLQIHRTKEEFLQFKRDTYRSGKKTGMLLSQQHHNRTKF